MSGDFDRDLRAELLAAEIALKRRRLEILEENSRLLEEANAMTREPPGPEGEAVEGEEPDSFLVEGVPVEVPRPPARRCVVCGERLPPAANRNRVTCGPTCRSKRFRAKRAEGSSEGGT